MINEGKKVYNLSVGTPDLKPDTHIINALIESAKNPENWKYSLADLNAIPLEILRKTKFMIVSYPANPVCGSFLAFEGAKEVGVEFYSLSKSYNITGSRVSFLLGNQKIIEKFKVLRSQIDYGIFTPIQKAAIAALNGPKESITLHKIEYENRRNALCIGLSKIGWNIPKSKGTMFV